MSNTASNFGLTERQADRVDQLWAMPIKDWPQDLKDYANRTRPTCGEELGQCIADWVKRADRSAQIPDPE